MTQILPFEAREQTRNAASEKGILAVRFDSDCEAHPVDRPALDGEWVWFAEIVKDSLSGSAQVTPFRRSLHALARAGDVCLLVD